VIPSSDAKLRRKNRLEAQILRTFESVPSEALLKAFFNGNPLIFALKYGNSSKSVTGGN
jgi:hypothetical protein